ncbi:MAG: DUF4082 domain-containing protein [Isosphaeraceae bacterium]
MAKLRSQTRRRPVPSRRHRIAPYLEILDERALPAVNPIVAENLLPGTPQSQWLVTGDGDPTLQGFTTDISVNHGQTLSFKINNTALAPYHIDVYRLGYYGGNGARLVTTIPSSQTQAVAQPAALVDPLTGMIDAGNWSVTATWAVPATATSGLYAANLVREDTGGRSMVFFVVRADEGHSDILMQTSDATWQTYNYWGGTNLYYGNYSGSTGRGAGRSFAVSYNRPMLIGGKVGGYGTFNSPLHAELPMIAWLEQNGYDVSYFTNVDSDRYGSLIQNHRVFMSVGHDEYWSGQQRANVEAALGAGVNLAFMSGNEVYWKTRWSSSIDTSSTPYRSLVCYKESWVGQPIDPLSPGISTGTWRDPAFGSPSDGGRPENALTGTLYMNDRTSNDLGIPLNVPSDYSDLRFWRNTSVASLAPGQTTSLGQYVVGYETDEDVDNGSRPAGLMRMSSTTFNSPNHVLDATGTLVGPGTSTHTLTLYRASSGALVFGAGTVQWSWGLSNLHLGGYGATADPAIQQATINLLADMYAQPQSLQAGLVRATPSTDVTRPNSIVAAPINGGAVTAGTTLTISGTASDLGGVVAGIEISTDGGKTWHPATGLENWSYTWNVTGLGPMTILSRAVDDSGNIEIPGSGATVTATLPPASTTGLVGAYGFNEGLGTTLTDLSGNGNNGTISRASWAAGISGGALAFNGVDSWVTISNVGSLNLSSGMTLEAWVKPAAATSNWSTVVMKERTGGLAYALYGSTVGTGPNAPSPPAAVVNRNGTDYSARGSSTLPVDSWSFLAGTYDGNVARFYLNGNLVRSTTVGGNLISSTGALRIGGNSIWGEYFNGLIDEVRVFNRPLSLGEITSDMNTPVGSNVLDATPPAGSIVSPAGGSSLAGVATLTAAASDNVQVASVQFLVNGQPLGSPVTSSPYSLTWDSRAFGNGSYVVSARIMDRAGNTTTTAAETVTVANPPDASPPTLSIKNPPDGTRTGGTVIPWAVASDSLGVTGVQFLLNGSNFGPRITTAPYRMSWDTRTVADGTYTLTAIAYDAAGNQATTSETVVVDNTAPSVASQAPAPGGTGVPTSGTSLTVTLSEPIDVGSLSLSLSDPNGVAYPGAISLDASGRVVTFAVGTQLLPDTTYTARLSGVTDQAGNPLPAPYSWSFRTVSTITNATVFPATAVPGVASVSDTASVELGMKFQSSVAGYVTGVRFYKGPSNTGTHIGHLWSATGSLLATTTFTGETSAGWQQASFATPVPIAANTTYVISYLAPAGRYPADAQAFSSTVGVGVLRGLSSASSGGNGVYRYTTTGAFPNSSFNATNYWVDVVFSNTLPNVPPSLTARSPAPGATGVGAGSPVTATFNEPVRPETVSFELRDGNNNLIPASLAYNSSTFVATLTPLAPLAASTTYTATVNGALDLAGIAMVPASWSFTTVTDSVGPSVVSTTPASGESAVALGTAISVTFSEPVNPATINFFLEDVAENLIPASMTYDSLTYTATLTPSSPLAASTRYTAEVTGAQDLAGNPIAATASWEFVTSSANQVPTVLTTSPPNGAGNLSVAAVVSATFNQNVLPESIAFTLVDSNNVPVSVTLSYDAATRTVTLDPHISLAQGTTFTATISGARDAAGNEMAEPVSWSFTTGSYNTLWPSAAVPSVASSSDTSAVELGVKFRSDVAGTITGIRFYKGPGNTGTHVGRLWDSGGNLLATATFSGETASGWQQVSFATPVAIAANTVYVASYHAPSGGYSYDPRYFAIAGVDSGPLHALADGVSGGNGLYAYGPSGTFPTGSYNSTNYWVDVVFSATAASAAATGSATAFSLSLASPFAARSGGTASVQAVSAQLPVAVGVLSSSGAVDKKNNSFDSAILDAGPKGAWGTIYYDAVLDQREKMDVKVRTGNTPNPSKSWSKWTSVDDGQALPSTKDRYLQYSIKLKVKGKDRSPVPFEVHVTTNQPGVAAPPSTLETFQAKSLAQSGERVSSGVLDAGRGALWGSLAWTGSQPVDSVRVVEVRTGKTPTVDTTWSEWAPVGNGGGIPSSGRYLTYRTVLLTASTLMMPVGIEFSLTTIAKPAAAKTLSVATASISSDSSGAATAGSVSVLPAEGVAPATTPAVGPQLPTSSGPGRARQADTMSVDPNRGESPASVSVNAPVVIRPHILGTSVLPDRAVLLVGPTAGQTIKPASPPAWWNAREKTSRAAAPVIVGKPQPTQRLAAQGVKKAGATGLVMLSEPE